MNLKHILSLNLYCKKSPLLIGAFLLLSFIGLSQTKIPVGDKKEPKLINIKHAKRLSYDKSLGIDARRLIGDVECEHDGAVP